MLIDEEPWDIGLNRDFRVLLYQEVDHIVCMLLLMLLLKFTCASILAKLEVKEKEYRKSFY